MSIFVLTVGSTLVFLLILLVVVFFIPSLSVGGCVPWCAEDTPGYEGVTGAAKRAKELREHYGRILKKNTDAGVKELVKTWHTAYRGAIPDATLRKIVNENTLRVIGGYYRGLTGVVAEEALNRLHQDQERSVRDVKKAKKDNLPQWKIDRIAYLGVILQAKNIEASSKHKGRASLYHKKINGKYDFFYKKIINSTSAQEAQQYVWDFQDSATKIIRSQMSLPRPSCGRGQDMRCGHCWSTEKICP